MGQIEDLKTAPLLQMNDIVKSFYGVKVLDGVELQLNSGEVCILAGENGAGKRTLMKILSGVYNDYEGSVQIRGEKMQFSSPIEAAHKGVSIIHQELSLIPTLNVIDNIFLGREKCHKFGWLNKKAQEKLAGEILEKLGINVNLYSPVGAYPVSIQQMIEIGKALAFDADIIVMDEPTSALNKPEVEHLFKIVNQLRDQGKGIIYISHKMEEIYRIADTIVVLRDGKYIGSAPKEELPEPDLISWMIGRELTQQFPPRAPKIGKEVLRINKLSLADPLGLRGNVVEKASLDVKKGEILGIGGLEGSGNHELFLSLFGAFGKNSAEVILGGVNHKIHSPRRSIKSGIALLTNDRKGNGLVLNMSIKDNTTLASIPDFSPKGLIQNKKEEEITDIHQTSMNIRLTSIDQPVSDLSGGNQQKVVLAKWLETHPKVLLLDDPTRGVDVGAKKEIYELMNRWTDDGMAIVLISSELPELMAMSDRILVMHRGEITAEFDKETATQEKILQAAMGKEF